MKLRQLEIFLAVAGEHSFSRAGRRLNTSQPALSRAVQALEEELGASLLIREPTRVRLTPPGERLEQLAREILEKVEDTKREIQRMSGGTPHLEIGYIPPALDTFLQEVMDSACSRLPNLHLNLHDQPPEAQRRLLEQKKIDIALVGSVCPEAEARFDVFSICRIPLRLAVSHRHPLARHKHVKLAECADEPFVRLKPETFASQQRAVEEACAQAGFTPRPEEEADTLNSLAALIGSGRGITLVPADQAARFPDRVRLLPISEPACELDFSALVSRDESRPLITTFLQECRKVASLHVSRLNPQSGAGTNS